VTGDVSGPYKRRIVSRGWSLASRQEVTNDIRYSSDKVLLEVKRLKIDGHAFPKIISA